MAYAPSSARGETRQLLDRAMHDLKESSRMVASYTQLLAKRYGPHLDAEGHEFMRYVLEGVARMRELIDALLDYSRLANAELRPAENVNCELALRYALMRLAGAIEESGAEVTHGPLPNVPGQEHEIARLFQILIDNAIKFRGGRAPRIHMSARRSGDDWEFSVADNGEGIEPAYAAQVFEPLKRLHGREVPGTGMGLAIARSIVERHGGAIGVESEPGRGSVFRFTIPA
jgi:light-regulated signal transduction histidine kinase (bacteriophytochrome)